jgi:branched-chain amino acid transport system substrate-binding protein
MPFHPTRRRLTAGALLAATALATPAFAPQSFAQSAEPIKIGFGMALTGPLGANGKSALLAMKIWEEDINAKGGLLGRKVQLINYDDQSNPSTVPGIYQKLLDVDKVDLVMGGYATNVLAPALPVVMQRKKVMIGLYGLSVNQKFKYDRFFAMSPNGQNPKVAVSKPFFDAVMKLDPKPKTIAIVAADAEFSRNAADGARDTAKELGLTIVYDKSYPPATTDFAPILRAIQATNPDITFVGSYPLDSVGMVLAAQEMDYKTKAFGGAMVGLQASVFKTKLGEALNGVINYDYWLPAPSFMNADVKTFLEKYQARAAAEGVDPLGYYMGPYAYAYIDLLGQAVTATKSLDDGKIADYLRANEHKTMIGPVKFGAEGEWEYARQFLVQFRGVKGNGIEQFRGMDVQPALFPPEAKTTDALVPFNDARKK